jgi:hypothetical protein
LAKIANFNHNIDPWLYEQVKYDVTKRRSLLDLPEEKPTWPLPRFLFQFFSEKFYSWTGRISQASKPKLIFSPKRDLN